MGADVLNFCMYGFAMGVYLGFLAACIYHIINGFFRWIHNNI